MTALSARMKKKWIVGRIGYFLYLRHAFVLSKNIKEEQSNLKKNDAKEVSIMYKELSDYINKNNLKMSAMTFDDELLSNARKNSIMRNMISDYLMDALQEKRRLPIPITLKEVNEIMPKRSVGKGLKEARI